ncbi:hypothetical protein AB1Y20_019399 [Prymnesium parvum]|uniref:Sugar phosphate transporter domain-containing protein n=1 Tax=Prymnesium parvum TaxID=97485 RepID=A0AB34JRL0_PRYPA
MAVSLSALFPLLRSSWYTMAATLLMTIQPFLTLLTMNADGGYDCAVERLELVRKHVTALIAFRMNGLADAVVTTTFLAETTKLLLSSCIYSSNPAKQSHRSLSFRDMLQFAVPAFVYFINNNLIFIILLYVSSTTYQILSSLKTVATGILFRIILKRELDSVQRVAILLLACGAATSQFPVCKDRIQIIITNESVSNGSLVDDVRAVREAISDQDGGGGAFIGVAVALLACLNSAFAGVYSELLLKKDGSVHSIHLQNMMLYTWGVLFNGLALIIKDHEQLTEHGLLGGYSLAVWLLVTNNALNGLAISAILKFSNNIVRVFAHTMAMMLTMILEVMFMSSPLSPQLCVSITVVSCATYLYNSKPPPKEASVLHHFFQTAHSHGMFCCD